jgi:hypothetical protein
LFGEGDVTLAGGGRTLGDFLGESEPVSALWPRLLDLVFRDSPRRACLECLNPAARTIYLVVRFDGEVVNGGFGQFLDNSSGDHATETLEALRRVGAELSAELLEKALTAFPDSVAPASQRQRYELLSAFGARQPGFFDHLDEVYYGSVDALGSDRREDLHELLGAFMRANATEGIAG